VTADSAGVLSDLQVIASKRLKKSRGLFTEKIRESTTGSESKGLIGGKLFQGRNSI
jgi:hypothetical protein